MRGVRSRAPRYRSAAALGLLLVAGAAAASEPAAEALADGDAAWARRAEGHEGARAAPEPVERAIGAYASALAGTPEGAAGARELEARWKLLRALHFRGEFAAAKESAARRAAFDRAAELADASLARLAEATGHEAALVGLEARAMRARLERAGLAPETAARLHFWAAIAWGAWAQERGLLAAVREGVAGRMRDGGRVALALDRTLFRGGPDRLLARLHTALPRVPFLTGWVDREKAVAHAESALALAPDFVGNRLLLALTILDLGLEARREEAVGLLREVARLEPEPELLVEELAMREAARRKLRELGEAPPELRREAAS